MTNYKEHITWVLFALVIVAIYLVALDIPLLGPDEPRYAQVAREMFERGDWVTTTLGGFDWFEKPALLYWLQITFYNLFGVSEFSARLGPALFGLGTIVSLWILGKRFTAATPRSGETDKPEKIERKQTSDLGNWMALIAASSLGLIAFSRGASFDITLTFPITASLVSFFIWETNHQQKRTLAIQHLPFTTNYLPLIAFYFFIGVALLAKGLIGIVFPFAIVSFYYVLRLKTPNKTFILSLFWGTIFSLAVASIWYLPMYMANGWKFIDEFFMQHHFKRFTSNEYRHSQPFWFFWVILPLMTLPWLPFFLASIRDFVKHIFQKNAVLKTPNSKPENRNSELQTFAFAWLLVPLVFFSLSGSKLPGYILPALPATCILTALYVFKFAQKSAFRKYLLQGFAVLTFAVYIVLLQFALPEYAIIDSTKALVQAANSKGYKTEKILNMHNISHNLEFYGVKRLVRENNGKQKRFGNAKGIAVYLANNKLASALVLVPNEFASQLTKGDFENAKVLDDNGELAIVRVERK